MTTASSDDRFLLLTTDEQLALLTDLNLTAEEALRLGRVLLAQQKAYEPSSLATGDMDHERLMVAIMANPTLPLETLSTLAAEAVHDRGMPGWLPALLDAWATNPAMTFQELTGELVNDPATLRLLAEVRWWVGDACGRRNTFGLALPPESQRARFWAEIERLLEAFAHSRWGGGDRLAQLRQEAAELGADETLPPANWCVGANEVLEVMGRIAHYAPLPLSFSELSMASLFPLVSVRIAREESAYLNPDQGWLMYARMPNYWRLLEKHSPYKVPSWFWTPVRTMMDDLNEDDEGSEP